MDFLLGAIKQNDLKSDAFRRYGVSPPKHVEGKRLSEADKCFWREWWRYFTEVSEDVSRNLRDIANLISLVERDDYRSFFNNMVGIYSFRGYLVPSGVRLDLGSDATDVSIKAAMLKSYGEIARDLNSRMTFEMEHLKETSNRLREKFISSQQELSQRTLDRLRAISQPEKLPEEMQILYGEAFGQLARGKVSRDAIVRLDEELLIHHLSRTKAICERLLKPYIDEDCRITRKYDRISGVLKETTDMVGRFLDFALPAGSPAIGQYLASFLENMVKAPFVDPKLLERQSLEMGGQLDQLHFIPVWTISTISAELGNVLLLCYGIKVHLAENYNEEMPSLGK